MSKWNFLIPFIEAQQALKEEIKTVEIADKAIAAFDLTLDREQVRKIISGLINEKRNAIDTGDWSPETSQVIYSRYSNISEEPKEVTYTKEESPTEEATKIEATSIKWNKPGRYLVLGCWHVPFHNKKLTEGVLKLIENFDLQGIIFNGDFLDCNSLSGHDRGRFTAIPGLTLKQEYQEGLKLLTEFNKRLPKDTLKAYMYGNHEDRYWRFVSEMQNAKTPPQSPREGLKLDDMGFVSLESYTDNFLTLGEHLDVIHGVFFSDHCAKKHIDRFRGSCLFAHTHRIQTYIEGNVGGFNIGWGGDKHSPAFKYADRATKASWQNGFAMVTIDTNGDYYVEQVICVNGKFVYGGNNY